MKKTLLILVCCILSTNATASGLFGTEKSVSGKAALSSSGGPNDYRSWSFKGSLDLADPLRLNIDSLLSSSSMSEYFHQSGIGFTWKANDLVSANYRYSETNDGTLLVMGNEVNLSWALDTLWNGELFTTLDTGYADFSYQSASPGAAGRTLAQNRISYGISQDLNVNFSVYAYHDRYQYDRNVVPLAILLIARSRNTSDAAYTLLAFPDFTNTLGFSWNITEEINVNLYGSRTWTLVQQELRNRTVSVKYSFSKKLNMGLTFSRATSTELRGPLGGILQPETDDKYTGINAGINF